MKTKTIEVKFPTIEGMKVENASIDLKNGLSVVEYVEDVKFKKGDMVYHDTGVYKWVFIYTGVVNGTYKGLGCTRHDKLSYRDNYSNTATKVIRLATNSEKQLLFDALEKDGKYWDSETLEVKELSINSRIDGILFNLRNCSESVADVREKIKDIINKEVNKAVNEIYK